MQKFTTWNMPVAVGVAATWGDYTTLPLAGNMAFYWWSPDPTFLELSPLRVEFPDFNKREHDQGIQTSQLNAISIDTLVSRDLPVLAPMVDRFADNLEISQAQMDALLLEQKNTGDSWENVTCRWVLANRATWQKWIPDQSACFPGFGLYDTVVKDFVEMRENATNQITCQARFRSIRPGYSVKTKTVSQLLSEYMSFYEFLIFWTLSTRGAICEKAEKDPNFKYIYIYVYTCTHTVWITSVYVTYVLGFPIYTFA
jgi:hypothetical protein